jgi:hypothetical protein
MGAKGMLIRVEAHAHRRNLTQRQENMLAEWAKVGCVCAYINYLTLEKGLGRRGIPLSLIGAYVAAIYGAPLGATWPTRFKKRRPDLKIKVRCMKF